MVTNTKKYARLYRLKNREKIRYWAAKWRENNPERTRELSLKWRESNKERIRELSKRYRENNRDKIKEYYQLNKSKLDERKLELQIQIRHDLINLLGGAKCVRCGLSDIRALQIDHINGGGTKEIKRLKGAMSHNRYYLKNPDLAKSTLQVLCASCNWIKRVERGEIRKLSG